MGMTRICALFACQLQAGYTYFTKVTDCESKRSNTNILVEEITREEDNQEPYEEITAAVERKLNERLKLAEERNNLTIKEAVKRALDRSHNQSSTSKKSKPDFKSKGNKKRYEVNEEVISKIEDAMGEIESKELEAAKSTLESGKALLLKQQKLIRMAEREENGWEVVRHYMSDDLASDSEDEKAIKKARKEALASINKRKIKRREQFRNSRYTKYNRYRDGTNSTQWGYKREPYERRYGGKKPGVCYTCGKEGHWQNSCPYANRR